jgi:hypothetical protein
MAVTEKDINELLKQINGKPLEDTHYKWTTTPIESLSSISLSDTGTLHSTYGAVPNVKVSGSTISAVPNVTVSSGGTGTSANAFWTTTGTGTTGPVWQIANPYTIMGAGQNVQPGKVLIQGKDADLVIGDKSMRDWMEKVEQRLNILTPNPELEKEWDDLRRLGERYRKLEKKCKEKADMWKRLKSMPAPNVK